MSKFLDGIGLTDLLNKIKNAFVAKADTTAATAVNIDSTPTANSTNLVTSGGVAAALENIPSTYAGSPSAGGPANKTLGIPFGNVDSTSTATVMTATVDNFPTTLTDGVCAYIRNDVVASASGFTLNVNGTGALPVYQTLADATRVSTIFAATSTYLFIYNSSRVSGGCWDIYYGYNANDNTIGYNLRTNGVTAPLSGQLGRYRLLFTSPGGTSLVPANTSNSTSSTTTKTVNQAKIDPFGPIWYYSYSTVLASGKTVSAGYLWHQYTGITLGYSFAEGAALTLTSGDPIYIKCAPQSDGSAIIDADTPYVQALPSTDDGKIYIFLGYATAETSMNLYYWHPVYYYKDGAIRAWTNAIDLSNVVHKTGDETIGGIKTFNGDIYINTNNEIKFQDQTEGNEDNNLQIQYDNGDIHLYAFNGDVKPRIIGVGYPVNNYDASNKAYVDVSTRATRYEPTQETPYLAIRLGATDQQSVFITAGVDAVSSSFYVMPTDNDCTIIGDFDETDLVFSYAEGISDFGYTTALLISSNDGSSFNVFNLGSEKMDVKLVSSSGLEIGEFGGRMLRWQNKLTFDSIPTANSTNPVSSGGVKAALDGKQNTISDLSTIRSGASAGATAYQKPSDGIPETDLASAVTTKLNATEVFWATYGTTTYEDVYAAYTAGKLCACVYSDKCYVLSMYTTDTNFYFTSGISGRLWYVRVGTNNSWFAGSYVLELTENKVSDIAANSTSTSKYPNTKAVADYAQPIINANNKLDYAFIDNTPTIPAAGIPSGGTTGQVLKKTSGTNYAVEWANESDGGDCNVFPVTLTYNIGGTYTLSETISDIEAAVDDGKVVILTSISAGGTVMCQLPLTNTNYYYYDEDEGVDLTGLIFSGLDFADVDSFGFIGYLLYNDGNDDKVRGLTPSYYFGNNESTGNKVTSLSSSSTDTQYPSAKCVYDELIEKANVITIGSSMPSGGFLPNVYYSLGTVSGSVTWSLASSSSVADEYMLEFTAASTAPTITWPSGITWFGGSAPTINANKTYQVSIQNNLAVCGEF